MTADDGHGNGASGSKCTWWLTQQRTEMLRMVEGRGYGMATQQARYATDGSDVQCASRPCYISLLARLDQLQLPGIRVYHQSVHLDPFRQ
jgi:hypothetical protein